MNGLDKVIERLNHAHAYVDVNDKNIFYYVDCSVIQDYGQVETFDNEHTVYERIKAGTADATLSAKICFVIRIPTLSATFFTIG